MIITVYEGESEAAETQADRLFHQRCREAGLTSRMTAEAALGFSQYEVCGGPAAVAELAAKYTRYAQSDKS